MDIHFILEGCEGFQWDKNNSFKSWVRHQVSGQEAEQIFFNEPVLLVLDREHSQYEIRFRAMGCTNKNRFLYVVFTIRNNLIRVISARDMNKKRGQSMKILKPIPKFKSEKDERKFWMTHDSTEYVDWSKAKKGRFPNLKPTYRSISLRLPAYMLDEIKILANKKDVPYQSLMKVFLAEKIKEEIV